MTATYSLSKSELNVSFLEIIKNTFKTDRISIQIDEEMDETDYLLSSKKNKEMLEKSIQQLINGDVVAFDLQKALKENGL